jgi:hypothetical protein
VLRLLGRRVVEVIDPDAADAVDAAEGRRLAREEAAAARATYLQLVDNGDGSHTGRFTIPTLHAVMLTKALHALTAPGQQASQPPGQEGLPEAAGGAGSGAGSERCRRSRVSRPELFGQGLCRLLERLPADRLPTAGGVSATVLVLVDYDRLLSGLGTARLDTGEPVSAGAARRLACEAGVIPVVVRRLLDGPSVVLDVGRRRGFHTPSQRIALTIRDGGCTAEGCDRPPGWCQAHHDHRSWAAGGGTSVEHGRLLCAHHHTTAHHPDYDTEHLPTGKIRFHRRT